MAGQAPPQGPIPNLRSMEELLQAPTDGVGDAIVGAASWLEKEPPNSITTWNDLVSKFANRFFPPSKTTNLRNEITRFQQRFVQTSRNKPHVGSASGSSTQDAHITSLTKQVEAFLSLHRPVNSVQNGFKTCGGPHAYYECQAAGGYTQEDVYATTGTYNQGGNSYQPQGNRNMFSYRSNNYLRPPGFNNPNQNNQGDNQALHERPQGALLSNTEPNPREQVNSIMTRSGLTTAEHIPPPVPPTPRVEVEKEPETLIDEVHITILASTAHVPPPRVQPVLMDALTQISKFTKVLKNLLKDKEKLEELANTSINVECSAILLNKVPKKLEDPGKFLIPCILQDLEVYNSLADYGASINLMPLSIYEKLGIRPLKPTRMTLELANHLSHFRWGDLFLRTQELFESWFTDEPALFYSSPWGDDDDDLFDLMSDNDEWKKLLYGDSYNDTHSKNDKTKDSKTKSLIYEANIVESNGLPPHLLTSDSTLLEESSKSSEIATLLSSPFGNENKVFKPAIFILGETQIFNNELKDKDLKVNASSKAFLIFEERNFLSISFDQEPLFHLELTVIETLLSFSSENEDKVFNPGILTSKGVHSFTKGLFHRTYETLKIINVHPNILNEGPMKIFPFFCFCPKGKGIRGESS
ncbi:reverse transcriptase domain-containing protein [Tanacetum coccineum]